MLINQSFIFAAGRGERMRPITDSIPKPLVKIRNKAIIDYIIEKLLKITAIERIVINGFYLADRIESHIKNLGNPRIIFSREISKLETGGGLLYAMQNKKIDINKPILLINGDILWQDPEFCADIDLICNSYNIEDCDILLGLKKCQEVYGYEGCGDFNLTENGDLFCNNKNLSHVFVGLQIVNPKILQNISLQEFSMNYFYKNAVDKSGKLNRIKGVELKGRYFHIGDVAAVNLAENKF